MKNKSNVQKILKIKNSILMLCIVLLFVSNSACYTQKNTVIPTESSVQKNAMIPIEIKEGDSINFGSYEQDNVSNNGVEQIEWLVLDIIDNNALLISKYIIATYEYNLDENSVTWKDCTLRAWLNSIFYENAFSLDEQEYLISKNIVTDSVHQKHYSSILDSYVLTANPLPESQTSDYVFVLSREELAKYFPSTSSRTAGPTTYVKLTSDAAFYWWTRTAGVTVGTQRIVDDKGCYDLGGASNCINMGVRPVIWINFGE